MDLEPYFVNNRRSWLALCVENVEGYAWSVSLNVPIAQISQFADIERAATLMLVDVDMYRTEQTNTCCLGSAISVRNAENLAWTPVINLTGGEFHAVFDVLRPTHRMLVVDSGTSPTGQRFPGMGGKPQRSGQGDLPRPDVRRVVRES